MKSITNQEEKFINQKLPDLVDLLYEGESTFYSEASISVFDHWLTQKETDQVFCLDKDVVKQRQQKFEYFITSLFSNASIYSARFRRARKNELNIKRITTLESLNRKCKFHRLTSDTGEAFQFLIPKHSAIYTHGFDWTGKIQYINIDETYALMEAVKISGIH